MEAWFYLSPFVSDLRLASLWLILSNFFLCTYLKQTVFNIANSVMSNNDTRTIFFLYIFFLIFNRETEHEKLRLDCQARFHADVCKGKLNHLSRPPGLLFHVAPLLNLFLAPKRNLVPNFALSSSLQRFRQRIAISHCTNWTPEILSAGVIPMRFLWVATNTKVPTLSPLHRPYSLFLRFKKSLSWQIS